MTATTPRPLTAHLVDFMEPGSDRWAKYMTASKIAAAVGLSAYDSPFSLWHRMAGNIPASGDTDITRRGHYLEPAIRAWFADQHPDWIVATTATWVHNERGWQAASPDAVVITDLARLAPGPMEPQADVLAEFKSAHEDEEWGEPGSDDIPVGYRCQVMWQMDTLGVEVCYVAVLNRHLTFAEYVVHYDPDEAALLRDAGKAFIDSIAAGDVPSIDSHAETYQAIRTLHPDIDPDGVTELSDELAKRYVRAKTALKVAETDEQHARSLIADAMGRDRVAKHNRIKIAHRQAKGDGKPYVVGARTLPTYPED